MVSAQQAEEKIAFNFLQIQLQKDIEQGVIATPVLRFPPEPNGYLHIGHAKSICLNFGLAEAFNGVCHLRFDDTNPSKEEQKYIDAMIRDIRWLGFSWAEPVRYSSDYFHQLYLWAIHLIEQGKAYVCQLNADDMREYRGTLTQAGKASPNRALGVADHLALFEKMRNSEIGEGQATLRAKIDMAHPNMNMRDPVLYRVRNQSHHQAGERWCIYPSYDFAHGQGDAIEGVTHSICTLEFADHRPLYEWFLQNLPVEHTPKQYEFARLQLAYTMTSKRKLQALIERNIVSGWNDPRMPTLAGMRRRGIRPEAIRHFCQMIGVTRADSLVDIRMFEYAVRTDLDRHAPRANCVIDPVKVVVTNYPAGEVEWLKASGHPVHEGFVERELPFTKELYIDASDYREEANKKYKRLVKGKRVRLRHAYVIEAEQALYDKEGRVTEIQVRMLADTLGVLPADGIKPKGVIHWVSAEYNTPCQVVLFKPLFSAEEVTDIDTQVNVDSKEVRQNCFVEYGFQDAALGVTWQFEREGYFCRDYDDAHTESNSSKDKHKLTFNRTIELRDTWEL